MRRYRSILAVTGLAVTAACGSATVAASSSPTSSAAHAAAPASPSATITATPTGAPPVTVTAQPPGPVVTVVVPPAPQVTVVQPPAPVQQGSEAVTVVTEYFDALNAQEYATAWNLGGDHLGESYAAFVQGYDTIAYNQITILSVSGDAVTLRLDATQTDGTVRSYEGTYVVTGGVITGFDVHQIG